MHLKKNIIVFGATGYIGKEFYRHFHKSYNIVNVSRNDFDFLDPDMGSLGKFLDSYASLRFGVDAILFLQGINPHNGVDDITAEQFHNMVKVNLTTPLEVVRYMSRHIKNDGSVTFVSSIASKKGSYDPSYASSKSGMEGLQATLSNKFSHVRFNTISLGLVKDSPAHMGMTKDFEKKHLDAMGGQLVDCNDVCKTVEFLIECKSISRTQVALDRGYRV